MRTHVHSPSCCALWMVFVITLLILPLSSQADTLVQINSPAQQAANDSVLWSQLGPDQALLAATFNVTSVDGGTVGISLAGQHSIVSVVCAATPANCSWTNARGGAAPLAAGDSLLWTSDDLAGGNGPVTLNFSRAIAGAGALMQASAPGQFTAQIQAFSGAMSLGTFPVTSDANGDPVYLGLEDTSGPNITEVVLSLTSCGPSDTSNCTDFGVDAVGMNTPPRLMVAAPGNAAAGAPFSITVTAQDPAGNTLTNYTGTLAFSSSDTNPALVLPANYTFTTGAGADNGSHVFNNGVTLATAGLQSVTAKDTVKSFITGSAAVMVTPGAATQLSVIGPPVGSVGFAFTVQVTARDQFGNIATGYGGKVQLTAKAGSTATATFPPSSALTNGVGNFSVTPTGAGALAVVATDTVTSSITGASSNIQIVNDAPLTGTSRDIRMFRGVQQVIVATVTDADTTETGSDLTATIDWGDGTTTSTGVIPTHAAGMNPNVFQVLGSHAYARKSQFTVTVTINDMSGPPNGAQTVVKSRTRFLPRENSF